MTLPETCLNGGTLALWVRLQENCSSSSPGILTSVTDNYSSTGFVLRCKRENGKNVFR